MKKGLKLLLCVDWEGLSLKEENLRALQLFKKRWAIPLLHFMNPAYFSSINLRDHASGVDWYSIFEDEPVGLHLHGSRHFVESCGIPFREGPCFSKLGDQNPGEFQGHEVMLHAYTSNEFEQMLAQSFKIFAENNWPKPKFFRAGGWMINPEYYSVLKKWGFWADSSSTAPENLDYTCWQGEPLQRYLSILWGQQDSFTQPYVDDNIWHIPNNGGAIDYWQSESSALQWGDRLSEDNEPFAVITIHQETAAEHLWKLDRFIKNYLEQKSIVEAVELTKFQKPSKSPSRQYSVFE